MFLFLPSGAQERIQVSGTILDENGETLIGASVIEDGTTNGTITDIDGHFVLQAGVEQGEGGTAFVSVRIVDAEGRFVPTATNEVTFQVEGPARLLATDAGDATSHVPFYSPSLPAFGGLCSAGLQPAEITF